MDPDHDAPFLEPPTSSIEPVPVLRVRDLQKRYGRVRVLAGLSLTVRRGEVYGFLGRNGAGKTTAIRAIVGIHRSNGGDIELLGEKVQRPGRRQKMRIGYVSQEQYFYPWMSCLRLGQFVRSFYPTWDDREFERLLDVLDLPPRRKVSALSQGMQVKLALALALAHRPELLLLDEPTAGLDAAARREFLEIVVHQAQAQGRSTLFSSHIVEEIERVADRVGILDRGRLVYEGRIDALRSEVRRVHLPPPPEGEPALSAESVPEGFHLLEQHRSAERLTLILRAPPEAWERAAFPPGNVETLTLEDIFLALAVGRVSLT